MRSGGCGLALVAALSALAPGAGAQRQGGPPPRFRSNVDLVRVDVVVVDKDGRHVRGLTRADFTLLDRGRPQEVATFDEIAATRAAAPPAPAALAPLDVAGNQGDQSDRLIISSSTICTSTRTVRRERRRSRAA